MPCISKSLFLWQNSYITIEPRQKVPTDQLHAFKAGAVSFRQIARLMWVGEELTTHNGSDAPYSKTSANSRQQRVPCTWFFVDVFKVFEFDRTERLHDRQLLNFSTGRVDRPSWQRIDILRCSTEFLVCLLLAGRRV